MHRLNSNWGRSLPAVATALAVAAALALIVAMNLGSQTTSVVASTISPTPPWTGTQLQKFTGVSCADIYLDQAPNNAMGTAPGAEDLLVAGALTRTEPSATANKLDITTLSYQGPDLVIGDESFVLDAVPDTGPTVDTCDVARTNGGAGKEHEAMHQRTAVQSQFGLRPNAQASIITGTYDATNSEDGAGANTCFDALDNGPDTEVDSGDQDCFDASGTTNVHFTTCTFSEVLSVWERTDSTNVISDKSASALNFGRVTLWVASGAPTTGTVVGEPNVALDPRTCAVAGSLPFASVTKIYSRVATTDKPTQGNNAAAISAGHLAVDADGCNPNNGSVLNKPTPTTGAVCNPKPKDGQDPDGWHEQFGTFVADDWDGDGCPDWDELDHAFDHSFTTPNSGNQNGMDPYNPNDCDKNFNGNIALLITVFHDNSVCSLIQLVTPGSCAPGGTPGSPNGQYFFCLTKVTHTLGADVSGDPGLQEAVNWIAGCYSDSTLTVVNGAYFAETGANCNNNTDNDADTFINDGCPAAPAETGAQCLNNTDDDADGKVNDGCPVTDGAEFGAQCLNNTDDDADTFINDGCPAGPGETPAQCGNNTDDDGDGKVNDGCGSMPDTCGTAPLAAQDNCGDGRAGPRPPGGSSPNSPQAFLGIADDSYPVPFSGVYDHADNRVKFDFCLVGAGSVFGPNVHAVGNIDAHTGAGFMDLHGQLAATDCSGTPGLDILGAQVEMTERGSNIDSDHDGCTDNNELSGLIAAGGKRDPFNKWDYDNPSLNNTNRTKDITSVVNHFGHDASPPGDPLYKERYDRGGSVPGSHSWNLLPPNGTIRSADITAAVNSFGHDCPAKLPPPYTS